LFESFGFGQCADDIAGVLMKIARKTSLPGAQSDTRHSAESLLTILFQEKPSALSAHANMMISRLGGVA
jgi:hypothetical protein